MRRTILLTALVPLLFACAEARPSESDRAGVSVDEPTVALVVDAAEPAVDSVELAVGDSVVTQRVEVADTPEPVPRMNAPPDGTFVAFYTFNARNDTSTNVLHPERALHAGKPHKRRWDLARVEPRDSASYLNEGTVGAHVDAGGLPHTNERPSRLRPLLC